MLHWVLGAWVLKGHEELRYKSNEGCLNTLEDVCVHTAEQKVTVHHLSCPYLCSYVPAVLQAHLRYFSLCEGEVAAFFLHLSRDKSSCVPEGSGFMICVDPVLPCLDISECYYL